MEEALLEERPQLGPLLAQLRGRPPPPAAMPPLQPPLQAPPFPLPYPGLLAPGPMQAGAPLWPPLGPAPQLPGPLMVPLGLPPGGAPLRSGRGWPHGVRPLSPPAMGARGHAVPPPRPPIRPPPAGLGMQTMPDWALDAAAQSVPRPRPPPVGAGPRRPVSQASQGVPPAVLPGFPHVRGAQSPLGRPPPLRPPSWANRRPPFAGSEQQMLGLGPLMGCAVSRVAHGDAAMPPQSTCGAKRPGSCGAAAEEAAKKPRRAESKPPRQGAPSGATSNRGAAGALRDRLRMGPGASGSPSTAGSPAAEGSPSPVPTDPCADKAARQEQHQNGPGACSAEGQCDDELGEHPGEAHAQKRQTGHAAENCEDVEPERAHSEELDIMGDWDGGQEPCLPRDQGMGDAPGGRQLPGEPGRAVEADMAPSQATAAEQRQQVIAAAAAGGLDAGEGVQATSSEELDITGGPDEVQEGLPPRPDLAAMSSPPVQHHAAGPQQEQRAEQQQQQRASWQEQRQQAAREACAGAPRRTLAPPARALPPPPYLQVRPPSCCQHGLEHACRSLVCCCCGDAWP